MRVCKHDNLSRVITFPLILPISLLLYQLLIHKLGVYSSWFIPCCLSVLVYPLWFIHGAGVYPLMTSQYYLILPVNKTVLYEYELVAVNMSQVVNVSIVLFISSEVWCLLIKLGYVYIIKTISWITCLIVSLNCSYV